MKQSKNSSLGFTLVELIVVITIIAILGTIAYISLEGYSAQARDSKRVSDIQNIKTSLELFSLNTGKYPLPDTGYDITYDTDVVWTQGILGDNVTTNLSRNLNSKPTDPLTELEYTYSVIGSQTQYELLSIYESDLISYNSILNQTNAAEQAYPKIDGTYNGVFVKTKKYYIPTSSIINAELEGASVELSQSNINSQVTTGGSNIPTNGTNTSSTGGLDDLNFLVFTGSLENDTDKKDLAEIIQGTYTGSSLANTDVYKTILETPEDELVTLVNNVVLGGEVVDNTSVISYSCDEATKPADNGHISYIENPTTENQAYIKESLECGYSCNTGRGGINCDEELINWNDQINYVTFGSIITYFPNNSSGSPLDNVYDWGDSILFCNDLILGGKSDWSLPTYDQLNLLYTNRNDIGGFESNWYWSSSEGGVALARGIRFNDGYTNAENKGISNYVRCIRQTD